MSPSEYDILADIRQNIDKLTTDVHTLAKDTTVSSTEIKNINREIKGIRTDFRDFNEHGRRHHGVIENRLQTLDIKINDMDTKVDGVDTKVDVVDTRVDVVKQDISKIEGRSGYISKKQLIALGGLIAGVVFGVFEIIRNIIQ